MATMVSRALINHFVIELCSILDYIVVGCIMMVYWFDMFMNSVDNVIFIIILSYLCVILFFSASLGLQPEVLRALLFVAEN